jgi:hypothetical protein
MGSGCPQSAAPACQPQLRETGGVGLVPSGSGFRGKPYKVGPYGSTRSDGLVPAPILFQASKPAIL